jgi:hypothetical protein
MASFPEGVLWDVAFTAPGDMLGDVGEGFFGEFGAGLAEGDCLLRGVEIGLEAGMPGFDAADNFAAGGIGRKHLSEKGPEDNREAVSATTAMGAFGGGGEEIVRNGIGADGLEVAEGVGGFEFVEGFFLLGFGRATEEQGTESGQEGRGISHGEEERIHTHA